MSGYRSLISYGTFSEHTSGPPCPECRSPRPPHAKVCAACSVAWRSIRTPDELAVAWRDAISQIAATYPAAHSWLSRCRVVGRRGGVVWVAAWRPHRIFARRYRRLLAERLGAGAVEFATPQKAVAGAPRPIATAVARIRGAA